MYQYSFEKLEVYRDSRNLTSIVYNLSNPFPNDEKFGLTNQMRRAAVSVCLNLAEGCSRFSPKEKIRFCEIAYGSLMEVIACLDIALDLNYISEDQKEEIKVQIFAISNKISSLRKSIQSLQ